MSVVNQLACTFMNYLQFLVAQNSMFIQPLPQASALSASAVLFISFPMQQLTTATTALLPSPYGLW